MQASTKRTAGPATLEPGTDGDDSSSVDITTYGDSADTTHPVMLVGYRSKRDSRGVRRLYDHPGSSTYVEVKVADIVEPPAEAGKPRPEPGQVVIWVRCKARILLVEYEVDDLDIIHWPRRAVTARGGAARQA
jgi:hypothetical protein